MQPDKRAIYSEWQVIIHSSENTDVFQWNINKRNLLKIGRIFNKLKQNGEIGAVISQTDRYLNCIIIDSEGNQLHCGNELVVYKRGNLIELRQDRGRELQNEILKTMPQSLEQELLSLIDYIENTTEL